MEYIKDHIPIDSNKRRGNKTIMKYLTVHSTANTATARQERAWLTNPKNTSPVAYHVVVDEVEAVEVMPLNEMANHTKNSIGNSRSIGVEITYREGALENAYVVIAKILFEQNLSPENMRMHRHWTATQCPSIISDEEWLNFQLRVIREMINMQKIEIVYNGTKHIVDGFNKNGVTYVGVREVSGIVGLDIEWNEKENNIVLTDELRLLVKKLYETGGVK